MPQSHRDTDLRACTAQTTVVGQSTVYVNNLLWAVEYDLDTHCAPKGPLKPTLRTVFVENKNVIVVGDGFHAIDLQPPICVVPHQPFAASGSPNTYTYGE